MACASGLSLMAWGLGCWAKEAWGFFGCQGVGLGVWGFGLCRALGLEFGGKACEFGCNWGRQAPPKNTLPNTSDSMGGPRDGIWKAGK